jgi:two-component system response regulator DegU
MAARETCVLIAEDDPLAAELIQLRLEQGGVKVIGIASNGREAVEMAKTYLPDILILDISMPDLNGLQVLPLIKESCPRIAVLILTAHGDPDLVIKAIAEGASGFLTKREVDLRKLPATIDLLLSGEETIVEQDLLSAALALPHPGMVKAEAEEEHTELQELTKREKLVLSLISEGYTNKEIAESLLVSHNTIKVLVSNIFTKLGVSDRTQAAISGIRNGFIE